MQARLGSIASSVRFRTVIGACAVLAVTLALAAVVMLKLLESALVEDVESGARTRGAEVARMYERDSEDVLLVTGADDDEFIQVVRDGEVVAGSSNVSGRPPLSTVGPDETERISVPFDDDRFLAVSAPVSGDSDTVVIVGRTLDGVGESTGETAKLLIVGLPILLLLVAGVTWRVVGRALAPVEAMRSEVQEISAAELGRRVPVSGTDDEIQRLAITMNDMLARLEREHQRRQRFVSDASHELRSPITSIRQQLEVALSSPDDADLGELSEAVLEENLRLQRLVDDLLTLARMDESGGGSSRHEVDLDDLVLDAIQRTPAGAVKVDGSKVSAGRVRGDSRQLDRLVQNLLDNALRYARSQVAVRLSSDGNHVVLTVEDDGPGIEPEDRARVFERFVRLDEARSRDQGGTGLGLAIVAEVARGHGGTAEVDAGSLGGASFEVSLPAAE